MRLCTVVQLVVWAAAVASPASGAEESIPHRQDRPPNKPYPAQEAVQRMTVPEGFQVEVVASEPDVVNPIAMTFDDRGRIWVTESIEYPRKAAGPGRDRVKILEDRDGDGRAEHITVFAEGMNIPTGVAVGYGGAWVLNAPDLLFLLEKDGKEISREVVVSGFGRADTHELPSSLTWGPDGWLYGLNGVFNPSRIRSNNGKEYRFTCAMWRVHPRTREFQVFAEGTSNPYGIAWDAEGSAIIEVCHWANDHLFHFVETGYYQRQAGAYPPFTMKIGSITDHGHQKTAYCGIAYLDTGTFPVQYAGQIGVGNIHGGCINVDRLERDGSTYVAKAEPDLLTANDAWFMPVSLKVGPDGCLYVLDWYDRYHCSQDAARDPGGVDRLKGRLYRLSYGQPRRVGNMDLSAERDEQLVSRLASPNVFFRESAQRILTERMTQPMDHPRPGTAVGEPSRLQGTLRALVLDDAAPRQQRLHALWSLIGGGPLEPSFHENLLGHADPTIRAWAVRAAGNAGRVTPGVRSAVLRLARIPSPDVQLQVAVAARKLQGVDALTVLVDVLMHCGHDKLIPSIVWPNLHPLLETQGARFTKTVEDGMQRSGGAAATDAAGWSPALGILMPRVIERMLGAADPDLDVVVDLLDLAVTRSPSDAPSCIAAIAAGVNGLGDAARGRLAERIRPVMQSLLSEERLTPLRPSARLLSARLGLAPLETSEVRRWFASSSESDERRLQALEALVAFRDAALLEALPEVLASAPPTFVRRVLPALGRMENPKLADIVLERYPAMAPELQPLAIDLLMQRERWARTLLDAVLAKKLPTSVLNANHLRKILDSNDREAIWAVEKAFGSVREERNPDRERVVAEMAEFLGNNPGDPVAGHQVFKNLCGQCHVIHGEGGTVGPDITTNGRASFEQLLSNVFDPSLVIGPAYQVTTVVTKDGRNVTGVIAEDGGQRVVMRMPGEGEEIIARNNIKYTRVSKLSMMPEGIEALLEKKDLADLFAFLSLDKPPADPTAALIPGAPDVGGRAPLAH